MPVGQRARVLLVRMRREIVFQPPIHLIAFAGLRPPRCGTAPSRPDTELRVERDEVPARAVRACAEVEAVVPLTIRSRD